MGWTVASDSSVGQNANVEPAKLVTHDCLFIPPIPGPAVPTFPLAPSFESVSILFSNAGTEDFVPDRFTSRSSALLFGYGGCGTYESAILRPGEIGFGPYD